MYLSPFSLRMGSIITLHIIIKIISISSAQTEIKKRRGSDNAFMLGLTPSEWLYFFEEATDYCTEKYGRENIISAVVHVDETMPHLHLNLVSIVGNKLSTKQLFTSKTLQKLQMNFHKKSRKEMGIGKRQTGKSGKAYRNGGVQSQDQSRRIFK